MFYVEDHFLGEKEKWRKGEKEKGEKEKEFFHNHLILKIIRNKVSCHVCEILNTKTLLVFIRYKIRTDKNKKIFFLSKF
jgi:hypothetical protein